jgi:hypothetical protein
MEETYQQVLYFGDKIEAPAEDCFVVSQLMIVPDDAGKMRIAASVGTGPVYVKFMKSEEAA